MRYWAPYNGPSEDIRSDDGYADGDPDVGTEGSIPTFRGFEQTLRELSNLVTLAGFTPSETMDDTQVAQAIQSGELIYSGDTGTVNGIIATLSPAPTRYPRVVFVKKGSTTNTSTTPTITINGLSVRTIVRRDGSAIAAGDLRADMTMMLVYDGSYYRLVSVGGAEFAWNIANPTIWIRTDGSDNNDGQANSADRAMATIQGALDKAANIFNLTGRTLTIRIGLAGTYDGATISAIPAVSIVGDSGNRTAYIIRGGIGGTVQCIIVRGSSVDLTGVTLQNSSGTLHSLDVAYGGACTVNYCKFTGSIGSGGGDLVAYTGGSIAVNYSCEFANNCHAAVWCQGGNVSFVNGTTITVSGTPAWDGAFAVVQEGGTFKSAHDYVTITGSGTGYRWLVEINGSINTQGGGATYLPGSLDGVTDINTGGVYV